MSEQLDERPEIAAAMAQLEDLDERPVNDHAEILANVHERLHATLDEHRTGEH